ncbi:MAG: CheY-like chemotaxis protein, partial [Gammaproteobacteria bacterium]
NDILDFSKIEAQQVKLEMADFDLKDLTTGAITLFATQAKEKQIDVKLDYRINTDNQFQGDPGRIRQILMNLIGNAVKFTQQGQIQLTIQEKVIDETRSKVRFEVKDIGIGIPEDKIATLFDSFVQADASVTRKFGRSGLGLAICKGLVEVMKGDIGIESKPEEGSLFWFEVILGIQAHIKIDNHSEINPAVISDKPGTEVSLNILLAEDLLPNQMVATKMLNNLGHQVKVVENGIDVIDEISRVAYDLILMDVRMPVMDGLTATREIRNRTDELANIPIIAMTANATNDDECMNVGMNGFIAKPISMTGLKNSLQKLIIDVMVTD